MAEYPYSYQGRHQLAESVLGITIRNADAATAAATSSTASQGGPDINGKVCQMLSWWTKI